MATLITADSIGNSDFSCEDWVFWHKAIKTKYGKDKADQTWIQAWNDLSSWSYDKNWCKYGAQFNAYVNAEGLPVTHLLSDVISGGTRIGGNVIGTGEEVSKTPLNVAKVLKWLIPTLVILAAIGAIIYFGKKYNIFKLA